MKLKTLKPKLTSLKRFLNNKKPVEENREDTFSVSEINAKENITTNIIGIKKIIKNIKRNSMPIKLIIYIKCTHSLKTKNY